MKKSSALSAALSALNAFEEVQDTNNQTNNTEDRLARIRAAVLRNATTFNPEKSAKAPIKPEAYKEELKSFLDGLADMFVEDGLNVYFGYPSQEEAALVERELTWSKVWVVRSREGAHNAYTLKIQVKDIPWLLGNFFQKVIRLKEELPSETKEIMAKAVDENGQLEFSVATLAAFKMLANADEGELVLLDDKPQGNGHIAQAVVTPGMVYLYSTDLKPRENNLYFRTKREPRQKEE